MNMASSLVRGAYARLSLWGCAKVLGTARIDLRTMLDSSEDKLLVELAMVDAAGQHVAQLQAAPAAVTLGLNQPADHTTLTPLYHPHTCDTTTPCQVSLLAQKALRAAWWIAARREHMLISLHELSPQLHRAQTPHPP